MNRTFMVALLVVAVGVTAAVYLTSSDNYFSNKTSETQMEEKAMMEKEAMVMEMEKSEPSVDSSEVAPSQAMMSKVSYDYQGLLDDVTGGETVLGINTGGLASGVAKFAYDEKFYMEAEFSNLPEPTGTDFYEGWLVRKDPFDFISTGVVEMVDGVYTNTYSSTTDYTDHDFYVLTIEPDDGDPGPADHVVEGTLTRL